MDIDVQGAGLIRKQSDPAIVEALIDVFILPPNDEELLRRLNFRGTETQDQLDLRLANAREEMRHWSEYRYTVVSQDKETDFARFSAILAGERCRTSRLAPTREAAADHPELGL
jgi:guanylate kinase